MNKLSLKKSSVLFMTLLLVMTVFVSVPASSETALPSDRSWGVSYDWSESGEDVFTLTGLNIDEILAKFSEAAEVAGFEMLVAQVSTGESMFFIDQTVLADEKTVDDLSGTAHQVNQHVTDLKVVNGMLFDMIMLMEWEDENAGSDDEKLTQQGASIDFSVQMSLDVLLSLDSRYVEYRTVAGNEIVGADMVTTMDSELTFNMNHDSTWMGGDDSIDISMAMSNSIGAGIIDSNVEWRLDQPYDVHDSIDTSVTDSFNWICNDDFEELKIQDEKEQTYLGNGEFEDGEVFERNIFTSCGEMTGNYASELNYGFSLSGVPAELMGLDVDTFNVDISDQPQYTGDFTFSLSDLDNSDSDDPDVVIIDESNEDDDQMTDEEEYYDKHDGTDLGVWEFNPDKTYNVAIDDSGTKVEAMSFLGSPVPVPHLGMNVALLMNAFEGSEDDPGIFEVVGEEIAEIMEELGPEMVGTCDDGYTELSLNMYNDGYEDCMDGSDEVFEHKFDCRYTWGVSVPHELVNDGTQDCEYGSDESDVFPEHEFECDNGQSIMLYQVNDGITDCTDESDEIGFTKDNRFTCVDMSASIPVQYVNDGTAQCADESDEGEEFEPSSELMNVFEHIGDSNIETTLDTFSEDLEARMTDGSLEPIDFPFTGADGDLLWYDGAPAGFLTFVEEKNSDGVAQEYVFIGPETEGYERAPSSLGFEYLVGAAVSDAIEDVGDVDELSDIVTDQYDLDGDGVPDQLEGIADGSIDDAQALASADSDGDGVSDLNDQCPTTPEGSDVSNDGCAVVQEDSNADNNTDNNADNNLDGGDSSDTTETNVDEAASEDGGMIPSVSFIATICVLALAGIISTRRD